MKVLSFSILFLSTIIVLHGVRIKNDSSDRWTLFKSDDDHVQTEITKVPVDVSATSCTFIRNFNTAGSDKVYGYRFDGMTDDTEIVLTAKEITIKTSAQVTVRVQKSTRESYKEWLSLDEQDLELVLITPNIPDNSKNASYKHDSTCCKYCSCIVL